MVEPGSSAANLKPIHGSKTRTRHNKTPVTQRSVSGVLQSERPEAAARHQEEG